MFSYKGRISVLGLHEFNFYKLSIPCICLVTIGTFHVEDKPRPITSEERRNLLKFFKNSKEMEEARLHEEEEGPNSGILLTNINMLMTKADEILGK